MPPCAQLLWGGLSPVQYQLVVPARHALNGQNLGACQNLDVRLKLTDFSQTIAVSISAHRCPIKKLKKTKMLTITVQYQFSILMTSRLEAILENNRCSLKLVKRGIAVGGGGALLCTSFHLSGDQVQQVAAGYARRVVPLSLSYQCLFLLIHLSLFRSKLDRG
jgi:hypothetical protein